MQIINATYSAKHVQVLINYKEMTRDGHNNICWHCFGIIDGFINAWPNKVGNMG